MCLVLPLLYPFESRNLGWHLIILFPGLGLPEMVARLSNRVRCVGELPSLITSHVPAFSLTSLHHGMAVMDATWEIGPIDNGQVEAAGTLPPIAPKNDMVSESGSMQSTWNQSRVRRGHPWYTMCTLMNEYRQTYCCWGKRLWPFSFRIVQPSLVWYTV